MIYGDAHPHFQTIKQGNTAINILDYYEVDDSDDNIDDDYSNNNNNNNNNAEEEYSKSTKNTMKTKWIAQKLNYIDHVKGHVITK